MKLLISEGQIQKKVNMLARRIARDFPKGNLLMVGVLKGSFIFLADLARRMSQPIQIDFVRLASYGSETHSCGSVQLTKDLEIPIKGKDVLIVEDIIDTGITLKYLCTRLKARKPRTLKVVALLDKPSRRKVAIKPDYVGFKIPDRFVVGYGLDCAEEYRHLRAIFTLDDAAACFPAASRKRQSPVC